ncbi:Kinesin-like protein KIN-14J [Paramyrothecium foliicola]|nr:Kinesin-like protein KIN-14J [Paramyrothecium foliicola]
MSAMATTTAKDMNVFARWRPLTASEADVGHIAHNVIRVPGQLATITATPKANAIKVRPWGTFPVDPWRSAPAFTAVLGPETDNATLYQSAVAPAIPKLMQGANCSFFAYGHSGSGKTHTMVGYNQDSEEGLGLSLAAVRDLFKLLHAANENDPSRPLGIGLSVFEMRSKRAIDLLNNRAECDIREGHDGKVHIRGQPEMLPNGEVRVNFIIKHPCWTFEALKVELNKALRLRSIGSSGVHDQSSRSHTILEFEIIDQELIDARAAVIDAKAKAVPLSKEVDDLHYLLSELKRKERGGPNTQQVDERVAHVNRARLEDDIGRALKDRRRLETQVVAAEKVAHSIVQSATLPCLGTKLVFVDLAGAEYHKYQAATIDPSEQTYQERQEGCQINSDVMALKEVMRAWANNMPRIPFRASPLTMVLREYFVGPKKGISAVIVTLSPAKERYNATLDSLRYGSLVGAPSV